MTKDFGRYHFRIEDGVCTVGRGDVHCLMLRCDAPTGLHRMVEQVIAAAAQTDDCNEHYFPLGGEHGFPDAVHFDDCEYRRLVYASPSEENVLVVMESLPAAAKAFAELHLADSRAFCVSALLGNPLFGARNLIGFDQFGAKIIAQRRNRGEGRDWLTSSFSAGAGQTVGLPATDATLQEALERVWCGCNLVLAITEDGRVMQIERSAVEGEAPRIEVLRA